MGWGMGLRVSDAVVADHDITNTVTGNAVSRGAPGVILKQTGSAPPTYRVRFPPDRARRIGGAGRFDRPRHQPARDQRRGTRRHRTVRIPAPYTVRTIAAPVDPWSSTGHGSDAGIVVTTV